MKYINDRLLNELGINWPDVISIVRDATQLIAKEDFSQPMKPYLRFKDPKNRIIAMPAYLGGNFETAGIKWIASFPGNLNKCINRAHSVIVLNDTDTGRPITIINTPVISGIRTASVSGFVLKRYFDVNHVNDINCGIIGFGPIGQLHLQMLQSCFKHKIKNFFLFDINPIKAETIAKYNCDNNISVCSGWKEVYEKSKIFITCTVSSTRYVDLPPQKGCIYLNISLRDFQADFLKKIDINVIDNWDEVCRENTDIEHAHLQFGLTKTQVVEIPEILSDTKLQGLNEKSFMFNPMGMAVYDIAIAKYYDTLATARNCFIDLAD